MNDSGVARRRGRVHPALPFCLWTPLAAGALYLGYRRGGAGLWIGWLALAGWPTWTLAEYALHRWIFHWVPANDGLRRLLRQLHHRHHEVQEWDRLVVHPLFAAPAAGVFLGTFWLLLGSPAVFPFFGGFTIGYLAYEYVHYRSHFGRPRLGLMRRLRARHLLHHFDRTDRWFGVSWPLWDHVFHSSAPPRR
jgi:sterol desaturase/sphingolipid hydroxylase (fatty acid hydroxylase superfamily)